MSVQFKTDLNAAIKTALKGGDKPRLGALRLILAAVKQYEIDERVEVDDTIALDVLTRMAKQRRESLAQYESAGRADLAAQERFELDIIQSYLPQPLSLEEIASHVEAAVAATGASGVRDMGKVMALLNKDLKGRADMAAVSSQVKARLSA
jgi:uncharacterized protein